VVKTLQYYIGVDGGGTKTAICAVSKDSTEIFSTVTGSASWREYGVDYVINVIKQSINSLLPNPNAEILGITMGLPCYGESADGDKELANAINLAFPEIPVYLTNDVEVGWAGALGLSPGINVVSGTGAISFGKNEKGETARCSGWSEFFGDEGSCYWVGRKVMQLFSKQSDGRMPKDILYHIIRSEFKLQNDYDFIDIMHNDYINKRDTVASLQFIAKKAALDGSPSAISLYAAAANELLLCVKAIRDQLQFTAKSFIVSYTGGLFKTEELILADFRKGVSKLGGTLQTAKFEPLHGATLLAFEHFNATEIPTLLNRLSKLN